MTRTAVETEIKFRVSRLVALRKQLRALGFERVTPRTREHNTLYDFPDHRLSRSDQVLRLRQYGKLWTLTHKSRGSTGRHKRRQETETTVAPGQPMDAILHALGLQPAFRYEKFREVWSDCKGHVVLDETPLGDFAEIEGPARWIDRVARDLGVSRNDYIVESYVDLFHAWRRKTGSRKKNMTWGR